MSGTDLAGTVERARDAVDAQLDLPRGYLVTAGLALLPLILAGGEPGNEIQSPMAQVILGGLLSSTFLNLVVVPVLYERWADL